MISVFFRGDDGVLLKFSEYYFTLFLFVDHNVGIVSQYSVNKITFVIVILHHIKRSLIVFLFNNIDNQNISSHPIAKPTRQITDLRVTLILYIMLLMIVVLLSKFYGSSCGLRPWCFDHDHTDRGNAELGVNRTLYIKARLIKLSLLQY